MKLSHASLMLGLALLAGAPETALAGGDWPGGMKGYGAGTPVPAPAPVPDYEAKFYFRADAGLGVADGPDGSERGLVYGLDSVDGSFARRPAWLNSDFETFVTLGVGVGYYWNDSFRTDLTAESRSQGKVNINGSYGTYDTATDENGVFERVRGTVRDETNLQGGVFLFNGYYDFKRDAHQTFVPYIGMGLGAAWNEVMRKHETIQVRAACDIVNGCGGFDQNETVQVHKKAHTVTLAASAMAGFSYQFSESMLLDMNYRLLYIGGTDTTLNIAGVGFGGGSIVSVDDLFEHQLRAGLRFNVN